MSNFVYLTLKLKINSKYCTVLDFTNVYICKQFDTTINYENYDYVYSPIAYIICFMVLKFSFGGRGVS